MRQILLCVGLLLVACVADGQGASSPRLIPAATETPTDISRATQIPVCDRPAEAAYLTLLNKLLGRMRDAIENTVELHEEARQDKALYFDDTWQLLIQLAIGGVSFNAEAITDMPPAPLSMATVQLRAYGMAYAMNEAMVLNSEGIKKAIDGDLATGGQLLTETEVLIQESTREHIALNEAIDQACRSS